MLPSGFERRFSPKVITVSIKCLETSNFLDFYCTTPSVCESHRLRQDCFDFRLFYDMIKFIHYNRYYVRLNSREIVILCTRSLVSDIHLILVSCINLNVLSAR